MRPSLEAGSVAWPMRILRPWVVATLGGLAIGLSLLSFDSIQFPTSYPEAAPRAAVYDAPPFASPAPPAAPPSPAETPPPAEAGGLFAPAEPIAALANLPPASDPAAAP